jgi:IclR family transcriptional regulator, pca regulon regulatory protein
MDRMRPADQVTEMTQRAQRSPETFVESFEKGLKVITAFDAQHRWMTLSEVAERTALTRAAARRFLLTLVELGFADQVDKQFRLTARVLLLGHAYLSSASLPDHATPVLEKVSRQLGESASVAVLDGTDIVYVARNQTSRIMKVDLVVGTRLPAVATSMGRVLLAYDSRRDEVVARAELQRFTERTVVSRSKLKAILQDVREAGYALVDQELEVGLRSLAVPLRNRSGQVVAAMNLSGQAFRITLDDLRRTFLPVLQRAAAELQPVLP